MVHRLNTTYVCLGKNLKEYKTKPHESCFIELFADDPDIEYTMDQYVHSVRVAIGKARKFVKKITYESDVVKSLLHRGWKRMLNIRAKCPHEGLEEKTLQATNFIYT